MQILLGIIFHFIGGFASGSFYVPFRKVQGWSWESAWIVGGLFSWLIVPFIAASLTVPDFMDIIRGTDGGTLFWTYFFGLLWGIGGLTFGLAMRYLGMSLGMSVALGYCSAFGSLVPSIYYSMHPVTGKVGNGASSWILHMAFIILVSNAWGLFLKEWKGVSGRAFATILAGVGVILLSVLLVGIGNSMM